MILHDPDALPTWKGIIAECVCCGKLMITVSDGFPTCSVNCSHHYQRYYNLLKHGWERFIQCKQCGKTVDRARCNNKRFCSRKCSMKWNNYKSKIKWSNVDGYITPMPPWRELRPGRVECLSPYPPKHYFDSPDKTTIRICQKCKQKLQLRKYPPVNPFEAYGGDVNAKSEFM